MNWISHMLNRILLTLGEVKDGLGAVLSAIHGEASLQERFDKIDASEAAMKEQLDGLKAQLDSVLGYLTPSPAVSMILTISTNEGVKMSKASKFGKFKLDVLDNGTASGSLTVLDAAGLPTSLPAGTVPTYASSDPGVVVSPAADGLSCSIAPANPPVLVSGAIVTVTAAFADGSGTVLTADNSADPINVVAGPAGTLVLKIQ